MDFEDPTDPITRGDAAPIEGATYADAWRRAQVNVGGPTTEEELRAKIEDGLASLQSANRLTANRVYRSGAPYIHPSVTTDPPPAEPAFDTPSGFAALLDGADASPKAAWAYDSERGWKRRRDDDPRSGEGGALDAEGRPYARRTADLSASAPTTKERRTEPRPVQPATGDEVTYTPDQRYAILAESQRREACGRLDVHPTPGGVVPKLPDYAESCTRIQRGLQHLDESLPNGQLQRTRYAYLLLRSGVDTLGAWLRDRGVQV